MCDLLMKPKRLLRTLVDNGHQIQMKQLQNYVSAYKKKKYGNTFNSLGKLEQWCIDNNNVPNSEDEPFIVNYKIVYTDGSDKEQENDDVQGNSKFQVFVLTKRLLCQASKKEKLHIDVIYKLNWQGFPVLLVGTTDMDPHSCIWDGHVFQ